MSYGERIVEGFIVPGGMALRAEIINALTARAIGDERTNAEFVDEQIWPLVTIELSMAQREIIERLEAEYAREPVGLWQKLSWSAGGWAQRRNWLRFAIDVAKGDKSAEMPL